MRTDKRDGILNKILNHCLNNDKFRQHAKNGYHTFLNKATVAEKPKFLILLLDPCHNAPELGIF